MLILEKHININVYVQNKHFCCVLAPKQMLDSHMQSYKVIYTWLYTYKEIYLGYVYICSDIFTPLCKLDSLFSFCVVESKVSVSIWIDSFMWVWEECERERRRCCFSRSRLGHTDESLQEKTGSSQRRSVFPTKDSNSHQPQGKLREFSFLGLNPSLFKLFLDSEILTSFAVREVRISVL